MHYVGAQWDERRNTSQVHPVPPEAVTAAHEALQTFRRMEPEIAKWIEEGHPHLTEEEHVARFGERYKGRGRRSKSDRPIFVPPPAASPERPLF